MMDSLNIETISPDSLYYRGKAIEITGNSGYRGIYVGDEMPDLYYVKTGPSSINAIRMSDGISDGIVIADLIAISLHLSVRRLKAYIIDTPDGKYIDMDQVIDLYNNNDNNRITIDHTAIKLISAYNIISPLVDFMQKNSLGYNDPILEEAVDLLYGKYDYKASLTPCKELLNELSGIDKNAHMIGDKYTITANSLSELIPYCRILSEAMYRSNTWRRQPR